MRAAVAGLALRLAGFDKALVYDGSIYEWSRWSQLELLRGADGRIIRAAAADDDDDDCG